MNPIILFDYSYYRIAYFYENNYYPITGGESSGLALLSAFQFFNILSLLDYFIPIDEIIRGHIVFVLGFLLVLVLNFIRYKKIIKYTDLSMKWDREVRKIRIIRGICILFYFSISLFLFFYLMFNPAGAECDMN